MSTIAIQPETRILIPNIRWEIFEALGASDCHSTRFAYDRGMLEIMSPSAEHEWLHRVLGQVVEAITEELNIPRRSAGATTLKLPLEKRGLEPDECYYLAHELQMRGRHDLDLSVDPPPDLAIEVDISRSSLDKLGMYADIGVPEVWLYNGESLRVHQLQENGRYIQQAASSAFPFLDLDEVVRFVERVDQFGETGWIRAFRAWVKDTYGHLAR